MALQLRSSSWDSPPMDVPSGLVVQAAQTSVLLSLGLVLQGHIQKKLDTGLTLRYETAI